MLKTDCTHSKQTQGYVGGWLQVIVMIENQEL